MPAEFLDVNYGRSLKQYLTTRVTPLRLHRFDPKDVQFADALVSSVVVAFRNGPSPLAHEVELTSGRLSAPRRHRTLALQALDPAGKWGPLFGEAAESHVNGAGNHGTLPLETCSASGGGWRPGRTSTSSCPGTYRVA